MSTSRQRRKQRQRETVDSTESSEELLRRKLNTLHGNNAIIWAKWQNQIKIMGIFVFLYALYHSYTDLTVHYANNQHLEFTDNVLDCLWQISVHMTTGINALLTRQYITNYPSPNTRNWLLYAWPTSVIECMYITHAFPMGTFYLLVCLGMVYFVDSQQKTFKSTRRDINKLASKLN